jgi:hypothetical protein
MNLKATVIDISSGSTSLILGISLSRLAKLFEDLN